MPQPLRSILAVIAGYFTVVAIVIMCGLVAAQVLHLQPGHLTPGYLAANALYSALAAFTGGWLVAYISGHKPLLHGAVLAGILLLFGVVRLAHPVAGQSTSYQILIALLMPLAVLAGAATERAKG